MLIFEAVEGAFLGPRTGKRIVFLKEQQEQRKALAQLNLQQELWEPLLWGATHSDLLMKITGQTPVDDAGLHMLIETLMKEKRFDLALAMILAKQEPLAQWLSQAALQQEWPDSDGPGADSFGQMFRRLLEGEIAAFTKWCSPEERVALLAGAGTADALRLGFLAMVTGYGRLALSLFLQLDEGALDRACALMDQSIVSRKLVFKKWVWEFHRRQPDGPGKKKLAKRLVRYGSLQTEPSGA